MTPTDRLALALGLGPAAEPILLALKELYRALEPQIAGPTAGLLLPCRAGCDACCRESVFLSAPEFLLVADHLLTTWEPGERRKVVGSMCRLAQQFEDEIELLELVPAGPERDEIAERVRFDCPLLGSDGSCRIYPVRELNARTFGQTWDMQKDTAYGCQLTHERLRVLPNSCGPSLFGARAARAMLKDRLPGTERVQVYPFWFREQRTLLEG